MTSPVLTEVLRDGGFIVSEANGFLSRDAGVLYNSTGSEVTMSAGLVVAQLDEGTVTASKASGTGDGTIGTVTLGPDAKVGTYKLTCITTAANGGTFSVVNPSGDRLADLTVGTAYVSTEINLTVADGAADWGAGAIINVVVAVGNGRWVPYTNTGSQNVLGILFGRTVVPATGTAKAAILRRMAEVNAAELAYDASLSGGTLAAAQAAAATLLAQQGIVLR